ncbi:MAG: NADH-quinone oxidoreductase subunit N [Cytophagaceae bacterium]|nr:NADH-quinone oxidoreductase subunit N [Cytophagaceae bacterium]
MKEDFKISSQLEGIIQSLADILPEILLASLFILLIILDLIFRKRSSGVLPYITLAGLLIVLSFTFGQFFEYQTPQLKFLFSRFLHINQYEVFYKIIFAIAGVFTVWFCLLSKPLQNEKIRGEFYATLVALLLGLNLMVMSSNLLMVYLSLEFVSICSYILATFSFNRGGAEAGIKYILFGAFSSGIMLYGMSLFYGFTGDFQFVEPSYLNALEHIDKIPLLLAGILTLAGFLFKISASPFHIWAPDVYQGAPTPVVAFFSIAPKAAGVAVLINFTYPFYFNHLHELVVIDWQLVLVVVGVLTLTVGNFAALAQNNLKCLLAFSSVGHAGFILTGMIAFSQLGVRSVLFYFSVYLFMNFAAFALVDIMAVLKGSDDVRKFKGLGSKIPFVGVIFVVIMVALTGLPPTAGFNAKLFVFSALWEAYQETGKQILLFVFVFGLLNTVIALFYYLKAPYYMFLKKAEEEEKVADINFAAKIYLLVLTVPLIGFFFKPDLLVNFIEKIILNF